MLLFGISEGLFNTAWCKPGLAGAVKGGRNAPVVEHVRTHLSEVWNEIEKTDALSTDSAEKLRQFLSQFSSDRY